VHEHLVSLKDLAPQLGSHEFQRRIDQLCDQMQDMSQQLPMASRATEAEAGSFTPAKHLYPCTMQLCGKRPSLCSSRMAMAFLA
jgi:hypothetical protein